jgi:hypothetical protein
VRPRGFIIEWVPRDKSRHLLNLVCGILAEYRQQLPLTIRQIFYRLVASINIARGPTNNFICNAMPAARGFSTARAVPTSSSWTSI